MPDPIVIKLGGALLDPGPNLRRVVAVLVEVRRACGAMVVVHGGGTDLDARLARLGHQPEKIAGLRVTPESQIDEVVATLAGVVSVRLSAAARAVGLSAVGLIASDGGLVKVRKHTQSVLGRVGLVDPGDPSLTRQLLDAGHLPVISSVCTDHEGNAWNVNADDAAAAIASALSARTLVFVSDVPGVKGPSGEVMPTLTHDTVGPLTASGVIAGGMAAKASAALNAATQSGAEVLLTDLDGLQCWAGGERRGTLVQPKGIPTVV
jgi:acetylglutamate kinase